MSFMQPQTPAPFVPPPTPAAPTQMAQTAPTSVKPPKKPNQPTFVSAALGAQGPDNRSFIGGTPTAMGA